MMEMNSYTVMGFWPDTMQRFAESFVAKDAEAAEEACFTKYGDVAICGVLNGKHTPVDRYDTVGFSGQLVFDTTAQ
jgi:hypothetical protein